VLHLLTPSTTWPRTQGHRFPNLCPILLKNSISKMWGDPPTPQSQTSSTRALHSGRQSFFCATISSWPSPIYLWVRLLAYSP
jgi:hypothetical protein